MSKFKTLLFTGVKGWEKDIHNYKNLLNAESRINLSYATSLEDVTKLPDYGNFQIALPFVAGRKHIQQIVTDNPGIHWIHSLQVGVYTFLAPALVHSNIILTAPKNESNQPLAEYVMAAALHFNKQIPRLMENQAAKSFDRFFMNTLKGKTMLILGYGAIGARVAQMATSGFGMNVIGVKRTPAYGDPYASEIYTVDHLHDLLPNADFVVSILPKTKASDKIMDSRAFAHMKPTSVFINIGRGDSVDETALLEALDQGKIAGAALDVFQKEPLPAESPLWTAPNVLISPHNAFNVDTLYGDRVAGFQRLLDYYQRGEALPNQVDKTQGY